MKKLVCGVFCVALAYAGAFAAGSQKVSLTARVVATFWGMLTATLVGMLFVPPLYVLFRRLAGVKG